MVPYPRTRFFGGAAGSHAGGCRLLLISPPDRAAMLRSGPQFVPRISSTSQALHFLRGRCDGTPSRGVPPATEPNITSAAGSDSPRDSSVVYHWNPPRRTAGPEPRRLQ